MNEPSTDVGACIFLYYNCRNPEEQHFPSLGSHIISYLKIRKLTQVRMLCPRTQQVEIQQAIAGET